MITAPYPITPQPGPLAAPSEEDVAAAYPELRAQALTLAWSAEALARQPSQLLALARVSELLLVPGPWPMRQGDYPGYFVPAWQLLPGARGPHPSLPTVLAAAAEVGWTSLELHRFMTTPLSADGATPAALLHAGEAVRVAALIHGEPAERPAPRPAMTPHRSRRRIALHAPYRPASRRERRHASKIAGAR